MAALSLNNVLPTFLPTILRQKMKAANSQSDGNEVMAIRCRSPPKITLRSNKHKNKIETKKDKSP